MTGLKLSNVCLKALKDSSFRNQDYQVTSVLAFTGPILMATTEVSVGQFSLPQRPSDFSDGPPKTRVVLRFLPRQCRSVFRDHRDSEAATFDAAMEGKKRTLWWAHVWHMLLGYLIALFTKRHKASLGLRPLFTYYHCAAHCCHTVRTSKAFFFISTTKSFYLLTGVSARCSVVAPRQQD